MSSARPGQWAKNLLVYAAFVFSAGSSWHWRETDRWPAMLVEASVAFLAFCALASAMYLLNDVIDAAADRAHPRKIGRAHV